MKYIKKINEYNDHPDDHPDDSIFVETLLKLVDKTIFGNMGNIKFHQYMPKCGGNLYRRDDNQDNIFIQINSQHSGVSYIGGNYQDKENNFIKYKYDTTFKKFFKISNNDPIKKQLETYEKQIELFNSLNDIKEKLDKITHYCEVSVDNIAKNYIQISIDIGFSEDMFAGKAMRQINK